MPQLRDARLGRPAGWSLANEARERKNLTRQQLANECGRSVAHVCLVLRGRRVPGDELLAKMAEILEVDAQELIASFPWDIYQKYGDSRPGGEPNETEAA